MVAILTVGLILSGASRSGDRAVAADGAIAGPAGGGPEVFVVQDLLCFCLDAPFGPVVLDWRPPPRLPANADFIGVAVGGQVLPFEIPPDGERFLIDPAIIEAQPPGPVLIGVFVVVDGRREPAVECLVDCQRDVGQVPIADLDPRFTPGRVCQPPGLPVEVTLDGRSSRDARETQDLEYFWSVDDPDGLVEIVDARSSITDVRIEPLPDGELERSFTFLLRVITRASIDGPAGESFRSHELTVVSVAGRLEPLTLNPVHPRHRLVLANTPRRLRSTSPHRVDFQLTVAGGCQGLAFRLLEGPPGFVVDALSGRVLWIPTLADTGRDHDVTVQLQNAAGEELTVSTTLRVLDPAVPPMLLDLQPRDGALPGVLPPLPMFPDLGFGARQPFYLVIPRELDPCVVRRVVGVAGDETGSGMRFDPGCADAGAIAGLVDGDGAIAGGVIPSGGYYTGGSAAETIAKSVDDEMTLEVWVSQVADLQIGASPTRPAYIWSQSSGTSAVSWLIGTDGDTDGDGEETYVFEVRLAGAVVSTMSFEADLSGFGERQIVFVKDGSEHRVYLDGTAVATQGGNASDVDFDSKHLVYLGAASGGALPFTGIIHGAAIHAEALSDPMIAFLAGLGSATPDPGDIDVPMVAICPDPHEIGRTRAFELDGSLTGPGVDDGDGGVAGGVCDDWLAFLRPGEWSVRDGVTLITTATIAASAGYEDCFAKADIDLPLPTATQFEVRLKVKQIAIRGIEREAETSPGVRFSTEFLRGDTNCDGLVDISDAVYELSWLFGGGADPCCLDAADINKDHAADVSDPQYLLNWLFTAGPGMPSPGHFACGPDIDWELGRSFICQRYEVCP